MLDKYRYHAGISSIPTMCNEEVAMINLNFKMKKPRHRS